MPLVLKMATPQQRSWCVLQLAKKESQTAVQRAFRTQNFTWNHPAEYFVCGSCNSWLAFNALRSSYFPPCDYFLWGHIRDKVFVPPLPQSLPELRQQITTAIAPITRDTAQSLGWVGHVPCDSRSTYQVSVRCVQNFESFSIIWCRCEVLSTPHLFSVSFWQWKVLLCSPCIYLEYWSHDFFPPLMLVFLR
jgi:hypothetical protein